MLERGTDRYSERRVRILFCDDAHTYGGAQVALLRVVLGLAARQDVEVLCCAGGAKLQELMHCVRGITTVNGYITNGRGGISDALRVSTLVRLLRLVRALKPDIIIVNQPGVEFGTLYFACARILDVNVCGWMHNPEYYGSMLKSKSLWRGLVMGARDALGDLLFRTSRHPIIAVSEPCGRRLMIRGVDRFRISVIENGLAPDRSESVAPHAAPLCERLRGKFAVGIVGRIEFATKGQDIALRAAKILVDKDPRFTFVFIGDGPDRSRLSALAASLKLENHVAVTGWMDNPVAVVMLMQVILVPSRFESFNMAALDAIACGKRVVGTPVGILPTVLFADDLCESFDPYAIASHVYRANEELMAPGVKEHYEVVMRRWTNQRWTGDILRFARNQLYANPEVV